MKITDVTPFLLRGSQTYGSHAGEAEATDQGDWLLLVRVRTDEGLEGWSDVETMGPVAARVLQGNGMSALGFRTIHEQLLGRDPADVEAIWDELYVATAYYGRRGVAMHCMSAWTTACGPSGPRRPGCRWHRRSVDDNGTGCRRTRPRCSARHRRRTPQRPSAIWTSASPG